MLMNINISYQKRNKVIGCPQQEIVKQIQEFIQRDIQEVNLYALREKGTRILIKPENITDLMKIEIEDKENVTSNGKTRTLRSQFQNGPFATIIEKLTKNTPLTGVERKCLVDLLQDLSKKRKHDEESEGESNPQKKTCNKKVQAVCSTSRRDYFSQTENFLITINEASEEQDYTIKRLANSSDVGDEEKARLMKVSFDDRRNFILLKVPPVAVVRDKYPLLFCFKEVKREIDRIFYPGKCKEFKKNMEEYSQCILSLGKQKDELFDKTIRVVERVETEKQKTYAKVVGSVFILNKLLEEDFGWIHLADHPHRSSDIFPHIDASLHKLKDTWQDKDILYHIMVENLKLCTAPDFYEAVLCLMGAFFIFNIDYPESCKRTLTVFEKLFLVANDTECVDNLTEQMIKQLQNDAGNKK